MNVKLLRKIKKHILAEPRRLYMATFVRRKSEGDFLHFRYAKCGTAACIAGWAVILEMKEKTPSDTVEIYRNAKEILDLSVDQADRLFMRANWPDEFSRKLDDDGKLKSAKAAAGRIEHFIKTEGRE